MLDRYEIGRRPTSACGIPTDWLRALGMIELELQRFGELVVHTPGGTGRCSTCPTPSRPSTTTRCANGSGASATPSSRSPRSRAAAPAPDGGDLAVETDRGPVSAPLVLDTLGWRRILAAGDDFQPVDAPLTRALEVHPRGNSDDLEVWVDRRYARAGYGWCFPAGEELRIGACSYEPRDHVREGTDLLAADLGGRAGPLPGQLDPAQAAPRDRRAASSSPATRPASACR